MAIEFLKIRLQEETIPDPEEARDVVLDLLEQMEDLGRNFEIAPFTERLMPKKGEPWGISKYITVLPDEAKKRETEYAFKISYVPETESQTGCFVIRGDVGYNTVINDDTREYINERAERSCQIAQDWLRIRPAQVAHLRTSNFTIGDRDTEGEQFPRVVTWWMWVGEEITENVGRAKLLDAPVYDTYELAGGVAWQLTEKFTEKPHPSLLGDLKEMFPDEPPRVAIGHD